MNRPITAALAALLFSLGALAQVAAPAPESDEDPFRSGAGVPAGAVAVLDDRTVSIKEFVEAVFERFRSHVRGIEALDNLVQTQIVEYEMRKRGLTIDEGELNLEYARLDERMREATGGKSSIMDQLEQSGRTREEFLATLRISVALQRMAAADFSKADISPAEQKQWLRSKTIAAKVERDHDKLPEDAAARVFNEYITRKDFAINVINALPEDEVVLLVNSMLQADLAGRMCNEAGIEITQEDLDRGYARIKRHFEADPSHAGIPFEDFITERTGMTVESYRRSPGFHREVSLHRLGVGIVPDDAVPGAYQEQLAWYGPVHEICHILIRGSDDPSARNVARSRSEARGEIENVMSRIDKGEQFEAAVKLYSEDHRSKFKGGILGSYTPKQAEGFPDLAAVLGAMEIGDVRGPLESTAGFHLVKLTGKRPAPPLSEEIAAEVRKRIAADRFGAAWRAATRGIDLRRLIGE